MNVLVTGGAGFIGRNCVEALLQRGHSVRVLSRSGRTPDLEGAEGFAGDVRDAQSLAKATDGIDAVIHCVGIILEPRGETFESVVRDGTRNLIDACLANGVKRIVYISALGTRPNAVARYHKTKWAAEEIIRQSGLIYTILRASIVFGPGDGFINKFLRMPFVPLAGGGEGKFQPILVKDLASIAADSLTNPAAENRTFDACGPDQLTFKELMAIALECAGQRKPTIDLPMWLMKALAIVYDPFQKIYPPLALFTRDQYAMLQEDNIGDNGPLVEAFAELRLTSLKEGLETGLSHSKA